MDAGTSGYLSSTFGSFIYPGSTIPVGTSVNQRIGSQIRLKSIRMNIHVVGDLSATDTPWFKILVGQWHDFQHSSPDITMLYDAATGGFINSFHKREALQSKKWVPMYEKNFWVGHGSIDGVRPAEMRLSLKFSGKRLPHKKKTFNSAGLSDWQTFIMFITDNAVNAPFYYIQERVTYTDV